MLQHVHHKRRGGQAFQAFPQGLVSGWAIPASVQVSSQYSYLPDGGLQRGGRRPTVFFGNYMPN